ncbi:MAG: BBP7 family outer membrane beta-barrel protein [Pirellulales bacterium]
MKISKLMLSLMITGSSLGTAAAQEISLLQQPASASDNSAGLNSRKHIGDSSVVTADETGAVGRRKAHLGDYELAPAAASWTPAVPASFALGAGGNCDTGCTPSCGLETACGPTGPSCGLEACGSGCGTGRGLGLGDPCGCGPSVFFSSETLLWWGQARSAPAALTTSAQNVLPVAGNAGVTTVVGGVDGISTGLLPGYRVTGGFYFGPEKRVGVSGRVFGLLEIPNVHSRVRRQRRPVRRSAVLQYTDRC